MERLKTICVCEQCGNEYHPRGHGKYSDRKYCSKGCMALAFGNKIARVCETCGKDFLVIPFKLAHNGGKYCSRECMYARNINKSKSITRPKKTREHKNTINKVNTEKNTRPQKESSKKEFVCNTCGKHFNAYVTKGRMVSKYCSSKCYGASMGTKVTTTCLNCGKQFETSMHTLSTGRDKYCSRACCSENRRTQKDEKRYARHSHKMLEWKRSVLSRDKYQCSKCGYHGKGIVAHHIIPFGVDKSLWYDVSNGITLCNKCHYKTHLQMNNSEQQDIFYVRIYNIGDTWKNQMPSQNVDF